MRYELMLPHQIRTAIAENWPVVLPLGVLEYHSEHLGVGVDTIIVTRLLERLEAELDLVLLPPFHYGAASYAVEPPEGNGSVQVPSEALVPFATHLFGSLLRIGFRNIHFVVHHQSENFAAGMPTDLSFKLAGRQAVFSYLERTRGEGWWGQANMANYYTQHTTGEDPFNWLKGHPLMSPSIIERFHFDHAGIGETSLMLALCPEAVDMAHRSDDRWYARSAQEASVELGERGVAMILEHLREVLTA
jgi:creatinine amidohydrolase